MLHLMRAFNASKAALTRFVLLGAVLSSHWATSPSTVIPEKDNIKCLCLIRRQKRISFFLLAAASSTGVPRIRRKRQSLTEICLIRRDKIPPFFSLAAAIFFSDTYRFNRVDLSPRDQRRLIRSDALPSCHVTCENKSRVGHSPTRKKKNNLLPYKLGGG